MKGYLAVGAALDGAVVVANQYFGWPGELNYIWGALAILWGFLIYKSN